MDFYSEGPDQILRDVLVELKADKNCIEEPSRNGNVRRFPEPVMIRHENPLNRVMRNSIRDANPFFHFMESLWMLGGMNTVAPMARFNSGISQYSDDGTTLRGTAYGYKWRTAFGYDQLKMAVDRLKADPTDRRVVMTMWDPKAEWVNPKSKDLSCNLQVVFSTRPGIPPDSQRTLDMTVTNRSNDIVYGCLGSNLFHFSFLLEYVAVQCGFRVGRYYQFANNLHGYLDNEVFARCYAGTEDKEWCSFAVDDSTGGPLIESYISKFPLTSDPEYIKHFVNTGQAGADPYLLKVATPIHEAWSAWKIKSEKGLDIPAVDRAEWATQILDQCADPNLREACKFWLDRRLVKASSGA